MCKIDDASARTVQMRTALRAQQRRGFLAKRFLVGPERHNNVHRPACFGDPYEFDVFAQCPVCIGRPSESRVKRHDGTGDAVLGAKNPISGIIKTQQRFGEIKVDLRKQRAR